MITLRLLADDLTGALDTAAELVGLTGPVQAYWDGVLPPALPGSAAFESGTRELEAAQAASIVAKLTPHLLGGGIAYKKIDSLLRGPTTAEIVACFCAGPWERAILAPAFPYQGRITRNGRQYARDAEQRWVPVGGDIVDLLRAQGARIQMGAPGAEIEPGINVFDAETDEDLQLVADAGRHVPDPILWIGTGGLAQALARGAERLAPLDWFGPVLGLFGSDHYVTTAQLAACGALWLRVPAHVSSSAALLEDHMRRYGTALASFDLPPRLSRPDAAQRIQTVMHLLIQDLPPPGTLVVAGGETLRSVCNCLGARSLEIQGSIVPGLPRSIIRGGRWDGVTVVSKSGAFGHGNLLRDLLRTIEPASKRTR